MCYGPTDASKKNKIAVTNGHMCIQYIYRNSRRASHPTLGPGPRSRLNRPRVRCSLYWYLYLLLVAMYRIGSVTDIALAKQGAKQWKNIGMLFGSPNEQQIQTMEYGVQ